MQIGEQTSSSALLNPKLTPTLRSADYDRTCVLLGSCLCDAVSNVSSVCSNPFRISRLTCASARYISPRASRFPPVLFYWIFIPCDIISLILQAVGGAMSSTSNGRSTAGVNIALAGLCFQVATLAMFIVAVVDYMFRARSVWKSVPLSRRFKNFCAWLALATVLILVRCCYRVYELVSLAVSRLHTMDKLLRVQLLTIR